MTWIWLENPPLPSPHPNPAWVTGCGHRTGVGVSLWGAPLKPPFPALDTPPRKVLPAVESSERRAGCLEPSKPSGEVGGLLREGQRPRTVWGRGVQEAWGVMKWLTSSFCLAPPGKTYWAVFRSRNGRDGEAEPMGPAQRMLEGPGLAPGSAPTQKDRRT